MRNVFLVILLTLSEIASAAIYYVRSSGNDSASGLSETSAWKTITKVNSVFSALKPGDKVLFRRGDTFYGTLSISSSGISGNPIIVGAYGTGANPVISGFTNLTSWTSYGGGIYKCPLTSSLSINMVSLNGVPQALGRYPNKGYLTFESHVSTVSITDNELTATPNWTGAEVVIRLKPYKISRNNITSHSGNLITYTAGSSTEPTNRYGYFIQNNIKTLDQLGEWYHDGTNMYMYFGSNDPFSYTVKASTNDNLVYIYGRSFVNIENISFQGANNAAILVSNYQNIIIEKCSIECSGVSAVSWIDTKYSSYNLKIDNCYINYSLGCAIELNGNSISSIISNNNIQNSGLFPGMGKEGDYSLFGAIYSIGPKGIYEYNKIENVGRNGIWFVGESSLVRNNFINNFCLVLQDAGGIYLTDWSTTYNKRIIGNIIINGRGNIEGLPNTWPETEGIYLENNTKNVEISNNTIANCSAAGIKLHGACNTKIENNTSYNNKYQAMYHESAPATYPMTNLQITGNIFFSKDIKQISTFFKTERDNLKSFGTSNTNYFVRPIDDNNVFLTYTSTTGAQFRTLAGWQSVTGQDLNSKKSPAAIQDTADIDFYYNETKVNKVIPLAKPMIDVKGTKYPSSVTLTPFTSIILMVDPAPPVPVVPVYVSSVVQNAAPSVIEMTYNVTLDNTKVPDPTAFTVQVNGVKRNVISVAITGAKVLLTIASVIVNGDSVTVAYTKPAINPLQTSSGGLAVSISARAVTNNVNPVLSLTCLSSSVENDTPNRVELSYNLPLANIVPDVSAFVVKVNTQYLKPSSVVISGTKVLLTLPATTIVYGDYLKVAYYKPYINPLQSATGELAATIVSMPVTNNVNSVLSLAYVSSAVENTTPYRVDMSYNLPLANIVPDVSAFVVKVNTQYLTPSSVVISGTKVLLTIPDIKIAYGDYLKVAYYKPSTNPLQSVSGSLAETIISVRVTNNVAPLPGTKSAMSLAGNVDSKTINKSSQAVILNNDPISSSISSSINSNTISIFPNPVKGFLNISMPEPLIGQQVLRIYDFTGRLCQENRIEPGNNYIQVPINLNSGLYIAKVISGQLTIFSQKLIVAE